MDKKKIISIIIVALYLILLAVFITISKPALPTVLEYQKTVYGNESASIKIEFFVYNGFCEDCEQAKERIINDILPVYGDSLFVEEYPVDSSKTLKNNYDLYASYKFTSTPALAIINISNPLLKNYTTTLSYIDIIDTQNYTLENAIEYHLAGNYSEELDLTNKSYVIDSIFGKIDLSALSLPVLTIILGAMDSINPCSFFILLFLLSLLLYTKSRKRMILIGGIFIFFSGLIYFLIMALMKEIIGFFGEQIIITILAGIIGIIFGILNIKDFFFFKKGPSASIPESQKPKLYKQMRKIVKITSIPSLIVATIILAFSANTVELLCSLNLPVIYTGILSLYSLSSFQYYMYLFFYNLIYIIPLLIITLIVVITLGRRKLSEFQGRMLKLFSGIMIFSLGEILLLNSNMLSNVFVAIGILILSLGITFIIYLISKFLDKPNKINA
jgi:hypothetical protein